MVEHVPEEDVVGGSSPPLGTKIIHKSSSKMPEINRPNEYFRDRQEVGITPEQETILQRLMTPDILVELKALSVDEILNKYFEKSIEYAPDVRRVLQSRIRQILGLL